MTVVSSWMMIELVMYGMTPSPKIASRESAPPLNRLRKPSALLDEAWICRAWICL